MNFRKCLSSVKNKLLSLLLITVLVTGLLLTNSYMTHAQFDPSLSFDPTLAENAGDSPTQDDPAYATMTFATITPAPTSVFQPPLYSIPLASGQFEHFYLGRPIGLDSVNWPLPDYLYGYDDSETDLPHSGLDFDAPLHTPIVAAASGTVVFTGYGLAIGKGNTKDPYGLAVVIRHDFSYYGYSILTVYGHMEKILVKDGQNVNAGDKLGYVGLTGNTSGPHVHFEVRLEKDEIFYVQNPLLWMVPLVDHGVMVGQFVDAYDKYLTGRPVWVKSLATGKNWTVTTYTTQEVPNDPYYKENMVLGDLPAGVYEVTYLNNYQYYKYQFSITPGETTFISFKSGVGFRSFRPDAGVLTGFSTPAP